MVRWAAPCAHLKRSRLELSHGTWPGRLFSTPAGAPSPARPALYRTDVSPASLPLPRPPPGHKEVASIGGSWLGTVTADSEEGSGERAERGGGGRLQAERRGLARGVRRGSLPRRVHTCTPPSGGGVMLVWRGGRWAAAPAASSCWVDWRRWLAPPAGGQCRLLSAAAACRPCVPPTPRFPRSLPRPAPSPLAGVLWDAAAQSLPPATVNLAQPGPRAFTRLWTAILEAAVYVDATVRREVRVEELTAHQQRCCCRRALAQMSVHTPANAAGRAATRRCSGELERDGS